MDTNQETGEETGGCACGAIRFRVTGAPRRVSICHCMTCRRIHGSAFGGYAMFERSAVQFSGPTRVWQSSPRGRRHFCATCGSVAFMEYVDSGELDVPLGAFDRVGVYEPTYELWCRHKEPWLPKGVRIEYDEDRPPQ
ncbi:aldehyde-activating protein [Burkholderia sp. SRS-W-2-2016]|uniref:GFA family protein n=1 Tax=Burkholderia sp. SRS-W-2-2016 TaxID=1926878 RepID=UPI00094AC62F|nr:GFA family protein [Burkholderia sp. SRS-W-2-2016]OLL27544.1 aldehyde-activating protein [Burkholderia sp. SRS-W-2-2016]